MRTIITRKDDNGIIVYSHIFQLLHNLSYIYLSLIHISSKVIRAVEDKGLIRRALGEVDKRQMYFSLTEAGKKRLNELDLDKVEIPEMLKPDVYKRQD